MGTAIALALASAPAAQAVPGTITTVAGSGVNCSNHMGPCGDGGPATAAQLADPSGVTPTPDGGFLIGDFGNEKIRKVSPSGRITTVAGTGGSCIPPFNPCGDGGPATDAALWGPSDAEPTPDGGFLVTATLGNRVWKVSPNGTISTAAGNGYYCTPTTALCGDGGPANVAQLNTPYDTSLLPGGGYLISDAEDQRIRRVSATGTMSTVAGTGNPGFSGDGAPAKSAQLSGPTGVAQTAGGDYLIADNGNLRIRSVSPAGTITTVAGVGTYCAVPTTTCGDGGAATSANLSLPNSVAPTADGGFLIDDYANFKIRKVSPGGIITTVAGTGAPGYNGDNRTATSAELAQPSDVVATPDQGFLIADTENQRIRRVEGVAAPPVCGSRQFFVIAGTAAGDVQRGTALADAIIGRLGGDTQEGFQGSDCLVGGAGADVQEGGLGKDVLFGRSGNDDLHGGPAADRVRGQAGRDLVAGGAGPNELFGGPDDDVVMGGSGEDTLNCGSGVDIAVAAPGDAVSLTCEFVRSA